MSKFEDELFRSGEPTYGFNIGDKVIMGAFVDVEVMSKSNDGKVYSIRCKDAKGKVKDMTVMWYDIRPAYGTSNLSSKDDVRVSYQSTYLCDLICTYHGLGIYMTPSYQRGSVWSDEDRERLLESIFDGADIGHIILCDEVECDTWTSYEILDGKQRVETIIAFSENRISYKGYYFNDLSKEDRLFFNRQSIGVAYMRGLSYEQKLKLFLSVNRAGVKVNDEHINNVKEILNNVHNNG